MIPEARALLITGKPGCGKTTLVRTVVEWSRADAGGFYTEEIREDSERRGFRIVTLGGRSAVLSHVNIRGPYRVGRYGVDLAALEEVGVLAIRDAIARHEVVVIDEIGKMELLSPRFRQAVLESLGSGKKVLATVMLAVSPFASRLKSRADVSVIVLDRASWHRILGDVVVWLGGAKLNVAARC
ncbi:MAG: nucleoside-triphosphatase [Chloroflexota bacterium]